MVKKKSQDYKIHMQLVHAHLRREVQLLLIPQSSSSFTLSSGLITKFSGNYIVPLKPCIVLSGSASNLVHLLLSFILESIFVFVGQSAVKLGVCY